MVNISDYKIRVSTELDSKSLESSLEKLQSTASKKAIKLNIGLGDLSQIKSQISNIQKSLNEAFKLDSNSISNLKSLQNVLKDINKITSQNNTSKGVGNSNQVNSLVNQYKQLKAESNAINRQLSKASSGSEYKALENQLMKVNSQLTVVKSSMSDVQRASLKAFDDKMARGLERSYASSFSKIQSNASKLQSQLSALSNGGYTNKSSISTLVKDLEKIKSLDFKSLSSSDLQKVVSDLTQIKNKIKEIESSSNNLKFKDKLKLDTSKIQRDLDNLRKKCQETGKSSSDIDRLEQELKQLSNVPLDKVPNRLNQIKSEVSGLKSGLAGISNETQKASGFFNNLYQSFTTFGLSYMLANQVQRGIAGIGTTIIDLDNSFRDLSKVAPDTFKLTEESLNSVKDKAIETGISVARSSNDIIDGTAKAFQMGIRNIDEAMNYAKESAKFANVSDLSQEDSSKYLTSIMSAYGGVKNAQKPLQGELKKTGEAYNNLTKFSDLANYAGNNFAVTTGDVGEALQRSASVLSGFGTSMQDSIALIIGMQESTQNAEKTGTALKSIAVNMASVKASLKDGSLEANKTNKAFKTLAGIDIWDKQTGKIKDTMSVLQELSTKWNTLNEDQKNGLAEAAAGKYHINSFVGLMNNWKQVLKYQEDYKNGLMEGSADKENERFISSIEGRIIRLQEELKKLVTTTISTDMFKGLVSGAADFFHVLNNIVSAFDKIGMSTPLMVATIGTMFKSIKALGTDNGLRNGLIPITGYTKITDELKRQQSITMSLNRANTSSIQGLNKNMNVASLSVAKASDNYKKYSISTKQASQSNITLANTTKATVKGVASTTASMAGASAKSLLLNTGITLLNGAMIGLASAGIMLAVKALNDYVNATEISIKKHQENIDAIKDDIGSYGQQKTSLQEIAKEYDELAGKTNKTAKEFERLSELKNIIAEIMPDLAIGYDENNDPILKMSGSCQDLVSQLDVAIKKKQELMTNEEIAQGTDARHWLQEQSGMGNRYNKDDWTLNGADSQIKQANQKVINDLDKLNTGSIDKYKQRLSDYRQHMEEYKSEVISQNQSVQEEASKLQEKQLLVQKEINGRFKNDNSFSSLSDGLKQFTYELNSGLDFSSLSDVDVSTYVRSINKALSDGKVDDVLVKYQNLRKELEKTGQYDKYEEAVKKLVPEMASTLGVSEEVINNMTKVSPAMKSATDAVDAYLQTFGKRSQMASFDADTRDLIARYDTFTNLANELSNELAWVKIDGKIQYDPEIVSSIIDNPGTPKEIKQALELMKKDGLSQEENNILLKISYGYQLGETKEGKQILEEAQVELDKLLGGKKVDIGDIQVKANYKVDTQGKERLEAELKEFSQFEGREEVKKKLVLETVGVEKVQLYADIIKNLPTGSQETDLFINTEFGNINQFNSYKEVADWIKANPKIAQTYGINIENLDKFNGASQKLNEQDGKTSTVNVDVEGEELLDETTEKVEQLEDKDVSIKVNNGELQGSAEDVKALLEYSTKLKDGSYNISFKTNTTDAVTQINNLKDSVNNLSNQFMQIPETDVKIETSTAAKNISGLKTRINELKQLLSKLKSYVINIATAQASKNITGLKNNVKSYLDLIKNVKPVTFSAITALASKNVTGLKNNISNYVSRFAGKTFTTTFKTVTSGSTSTPKPSGNQGVGQSISTPTQVNTFSTLSQPQASTMLQAQANETGISSQSTPSVFTSGTSRATSKTPIDLSGSNIENTFKFDIELLEELNNRIKMVENSLQKLDTAMENAVGQDKIKYLQQQNVLYEEQKKLQKELEDGLIRQRNNYKYNLEKKGLQFNNDGNVTNYEEKMLAMEKEVARLEEIANKDKATDKQKTQYDDAKKNLDEVKKLYEAYIKIQLDDLPKAQNEWDKLNNEIIKNNEAIERVAIDRLDTKIERADEEELVGLLEQKRSLLEELASKKKEYLDLLIKQGASEGEIEKAADAWEDVKHEIKETNKELDDIIAKQKKFEKDKAEAIRKATEDIMKVTQDLIQTQMDINKKHIDMLEKSMKLSNFDPQQSYESLQKQIDLLEKQKNLQTQMNKELEKQKEYYKNRLVSFGIKFDDKGIATNTEQVLEQIKRAMANATDSDELSSLEEKFNDIVGVLGDYNNALGSIVDNQGNLVDLQLEIEDVYTSMLETTKKIEDKITSIIEKQVEERKKLIQEELDKRLDSLKKEQDAYNEKRNKEDWDKDNEKRLKELNDLKAKIDAVSKDNSMAGQAKLAELLEELAKKQEEYDDFIQDKVDKDINDFYDKESDRLQEEADKAKEELDKNLDKEQLYDTIKDALNTGKIKDIDGNLIDLKDAIFNYEDKYGDGLSVLGGLIKKDLLSQLDISLDTMKNIEDILKKLNISDLSKLMVNVPQSSQFGMNRYNYDNYRTQAISSINFNESLITVQGNVTKDSLPELKNMIKQAEIEITNNIIKSFR